jgi:hypothetical protein
MPCLCGLTTHKLTLPLCCGRWHAIANAAINRGAAGQVNPVNPGSAAQKVITDPAQAARQMDVFDPNAPVNNGLEGKMNPLVPGSVPRKIQTKAAEEITRPVREPIEQVGKTIEEQGGKAGYVK